MTASEDHNAVSGGREGRPMLNAISLVGGEDSLGEFTCMGAFLIGTAIVVLLGFPLRRFGRWLQKKGRDAENNREDAAR
jgi:hypothetical protein